MTVIPKLEPEFREDALLIQKLLPEVAYLCVARLLRATLHFLAGLSVKAAIWISVVHSVTIVDHLRDRKVLIRWIGPVLRPDDINRRVR